MLRESCPISRVHTSPTVCRATLSGLRDSHVSGMSSTYGERFLASNRSAAVLTFSRTLFARSEGRPLSVLSSDAR